MKKLLFITLSLLTATIIVTANNATIKDTKTSEVKTVEIVEQIKPIVETEEASIIQPIEQVTIEEPKIVTEEEKQLYIQKKYQENYNYFFKQSINLQVWFGYYFYVYPDKFIYDVIDVNIEKIKQHFIDITQETPYELVLERAQTLVL